LEFVSEEGRATSRSRIVAGHKAGYVYVFLNTVDENDREATFRELSGRCFIVRALYPQAKVVIGIAFEWQTENRTYGIMFFRFDPEEWTAEDHRNAKKGVEITGWYKGAIWRTKFVEEYPS